LFGPLFREAPVLRHRREMERRTELREQLLQQRAPLALRHRHPVAPTGGEEVEGHEARGCLLRELRHARGGGVQPHLQRVEVETARGRDHDLAIDHTAFRQLFEQRVVQFREIAVERLQVTALDVDVRGAAKHDRAEPVPLGLEQKGPVVGQRFRQLGEHRLDRRCYGKPITQGSAAAVPSPRRPIWSNQWSTTLSSSPRPLPSWRTMRNRPPSGDTSYEEALPATPTWYFPPNSARGGPARCSAPSCIATSYSESPVRNKSSRPPRPHRCSA